MPATPLHGLANRLTSGALAQRSPKSPSAITREPGPLPVTRLLTTGGGGASTKTLVHDNTTVGELTALISGKQSPDRQSRGPIPLLAGSSGDPASAAEADANSADFGQVESEQWVAYERHQYQRYLNMVSLAIDLVMHTILAAWMALLLDEDSDQCFGGGGGGKGHRRKVHAAAEGGAHPAKEVPSNFRWPNSLFLPLSLPAKLSISFG